MAHSHRDTPEGSLLHYRAAFQADAARSPSLTYLNAIAALLELLVAQGTVPVYFARRSHDALLLVAHSEYEIWRARPFLGVSAYPDGTFEVHLWQQVGVLIESRLASSLEEVRSLVVSWLPQVQRFT